MLLFGGDNKALTKLVLQMNFWGHSAPEASEENVTIGHENTGVVVDMGSAVRGFKIGDKVGCLGCSYACCEKL